MLDQTFIKELNVLDGAEIKKALFTENARLG